MGVAGSIYGQASFSWGKEDEKSGTLPNNAIACTKNARRIVKRTNNVPGVLAVYSWPLCDGVLLSKYVCQKLDGKRRKQGGQM